MVWFLSKHKLWYNFLMKSYAYKFIVFLLLTTLFIPLVTEGVVRIDNPLQYTSFTDLIYRIIDFIFYLAIGIAPIMIIIAGFYFITATGEPTKIDTAKKIIRWTLIGLLVVMSAKGLIVLFKEIFGVGNGITALPNCYTYIKNITK